MGNSQYGHAERAMRCCSDFSLVFLWVVSLSIELPAVLGAHHLGDVSKKTDQRVSQTHRTAARSGELAMPRAIVHIGPHKTGSTTIQTVMVAQKDDFEKDNIFSTHTVKCPKADLALYAHLSPGGATRAVDGLRRCGEYKSLDEYKDFIDAHRQPGHTILLSCEGFGVFKEESIRQLHALLTGYEVIIFGYYRPYVERLFSYQGELVHDKLDLIKPFFGDFMMHGVFQSDAQVLSLYSKYFGNNSMIIADWYGSLKIGKSPSTVFLCYVMGSCSEGIMQEDVVRNPHHDEAERYRAQMYSLLHDLALKRGCALTEASAFYVTEEFYDEYFAPMKVKLRSFRPAQLNALSQYIDSDIRLRLDLLFADKSANGPYLFGWEYKEVDREYYSHDSGLNKLSSVFDKLLKVNRILCPNTK